MPAGLSLPAIDVETLGVWIAAALTLAVLSAAVAENKASRLAFALLIGGAVGYAGAVTLRAVLWPRALLVWRDPIGHWPTLLWFVLGLLLLARGVSSASWLSNVSLAYLIGVGAALAVGGAVLGTIVPQVLSVAAERSGMGGSRLATANAVLIALGTGAVLFRFAYTGQSGRGGALARLWSGLVRSWGRAGHAFILIAFGALFATTIVTLLGLLASRIQFLIVDWLRLVPR